MYPVRPFGLMCASGNASVCVPKRFRSISTRLASEEQIARCLRRYCSRFAPGGLVARAEELDDGDDTIAALAVNDFEKGFGHRLGFRLDEERFRDSHGS